MVTEVDVFRRWTRIRVKVGEIGKYSSPALSVDKVLIGCIGRVFVRVMCAVRGTLSPRILKKRVSLKLVMLRLFYFVFFLLDFNPAQCEHWKVLSVVVLLVHRITGERKN